MNLAAACCRLGLAKKSKKSIAICGKARIALATVCSEMCFCFKRLDHAVWADPMAQNSERGNRLSCIINVGFIGGSYGHVSVAPSTFSFHWPHQIQEDLSLSQSCHVRQMLTGSVLGIGVHLE